MAADINTLIPEFKSQVQQMLQFCTDRGTPMRPYFCVRTPIEQARLWRQSRSSEEIRTKINELNAHGAPFLAHCLHSAGPQHGDPVTNALPGLSWHQWGQAVDCFWLVDGKTEWSTLKSIHGRNGYHVYVDAAQSCGLTPGGGWKRFKDWPHVQWLAASSPLKEYSLQEIDQTMAARFASQAPSG